MRKATPITYTEGNRLMIVKILWFFYWNPPKMNRQIEREEGRKGDRDRAKEITSKKCSI
jgi:hypothetical protein